MCFHHIEYAKFCYGYFDYMNLLTTVIILVVIWSSIVIILVGLNQEGEEIPLLNLTTLFEQGI